MNSWCVLNMDLFSNFPWRYSLAMSESSVVSWLFDWLLSSMFCWSFLICSRAFLRLLGGLVVDEACFFNAMMVPIIRIKTMVSASHCHPSRMGAFSVVSTMSTISGITVIGWGVFIEGWGYL